MTDNEIIKALECCKYSVHNKDCGHCPYVECETQIGCVGELLTDTLDLINRQKEDVEIYMRKEKFINAKCDSILDNLEKLNIDFPKAIVAAKSEAIKEIAEQVKDYFREKAIEIFGDMADSVEYLTIDTKQTEIDIDNIVKEMVGE